MKAYRKRPGEFKSYGQHESGEKMSKWSGKVYLAPSGEWAFKFFEDAEEMGGGAGFESEDEARQACDEILSGREEAPAPIVEQWRQVALDFHAIRDSVQQRNLPADFEPGDLAHFLERGGLSPAIASVHRFLLHIYNSENPFDLAETQRWDRDHRQAFVRWATGTNGWSCRYF